MNQAWKPYEVTPHALGVGTSVGDLVDHLRTASDLEELLISKKALMFRGFAVTADTFEDVIDLLLPDRLSYVYGNVPHTRIGKGIYTSAGYRPEVVVPPHNQLCYTGCWPSRLLILCERAARTGGQTILVDGARWLTSLDPEVRAAYAGGVRYRRNLHGGLGLGHSWQEAFETERREVVEAHLARVGACWRWRPDGGLRVTQVTPAVTTHPVTGAEVWFNQSDLWNGDAFADQSPAALRSIMPDGELPAVVTFADGRPIPTRYLDHVRERALAHAVDVQWGDGDLLLVDNVLLGTGRRPFTGRRRMLVAMSY